MITSSDTPDREFRRASFCGASGCVEVAIDGPTIAVRDSKRTDSPVLLFDAQEWRAFLLGVKAGEFDGADTPIVQSAGQVTSR